MNNVYKLNLQLQTFSISHAQQAHIATYSTILLERSMFFLENKEPLTNWWLEKFEDTKDQKPCGKTFEVMIST